MHKSRTMSVKTFPSGNDTFFLTPPPMPLPLRNPLTEATPLGDSDLTPKIQLCLELRSKEIPSANKKLLKSNSKKTEHKFLEVTVLWVKHLPIDGPKRPNPCVKLRLTPQDDLHITELKTEKSDAQYIEVFTFPLKSPSSTLTGNCLEVLVCENKATRNAKQHGGVTIPLDNLELGKPLTKWYHLTKPKPTPTRLNSSTAAEMNKTSTPKPQKRSANRRSLAAKEESGNLTLPFSQLTIS